MACACPASAADACTQVSFAELAGKALRQMLQVGKALCDGRGARTPDRLFVLLNMHKALVVRRRQRGPGPCTHPTQRLGQSPHITSSTARRA